jgi:polyisoprenoid-binding protein YceI
MKIITSTIFALILMYQANAQGKYLTKTGYVSFYSHSIVEDIKAENTQVLCVFDEETGKITIKMLMRSFQFEKALMQEHFNENYIESEKYPKASFVGKIVNYTPLKEGANTVMIKGKLKIHGQEKEIQEEATIIKSDDEINLSGNFMVNVADFDIKIPSVVKKNIAEKIKVNVNIILKPYE